MDRRVLFATVINLASMLGSLLAFVAVWLASAWLGETYLGHAELGEVIILSAIALYCIVYLAHDNAKFKVERERFREQQLIDRIARTGDQ